MITQAITVSIIKIEISIAFFYFLVFKNEINKIEPITNESKNKNINNLAKIIFFPLGL